MSGDEPTGSPRDLRIAADHARGEALYWIERGEREKALTLRRTSRILRDRARRAEAKRAHRAAAVDDLGDSALTRW